MCWASADIKISCITVSRACLGVSAGLASSARTANAPRTPFASLIDCHSSGSLAALSSGMSSDLCLLRTLTARRARLFNGGSRPGSPASSATCQISSSLSQSPSSPAAGQQFSALSSLSGTMSGMPTYSVSSMSSSSSTPRGPWTTGTPACGMSWTYGRGFSSCSTPGSGSIRS